jgi:nucleoside-diphosphate-sugar epimerase
MIVITGADGFVGSALVAHCMATGRSHVAVVRRPASPHKGDSPYRARVDDLATASDAALDAIVDGAAAVVHLAGRAHVVADAAADPAALYGAANVVALQRIAAAAVRGGVRRFVLASTIKVHGESTVPGRPFRAGDALNPQDAYARSKVEAEKSLDAIAAGTSLEPVVLRLPLVYGPRVRGNFLALLDAIGRGAPMPFGRIANRRDLLYVGNLVQAIVALIDTAERVTGAWLAADGEAVSTAELVRRIAAALDVPARVLDVPKPLVVLVAKAMGRGALVSRTVDSLEVDASPLAKRIGPPFFTLDRGLASTAAWWRLRHAI